VTHGISIHPPSESWEQACRSEPGSRRAHHQKQVCSYISCLSLYCVVIPVGGEVGGALSSQNHVSRPQESPGGSQADTEL
jgi:hypothetical protein